jgi:hypothetical protein
VVSWLKNLSLFLVFLLEDSMNLQDLAANAIVKSDNIKGMQGNTDHLHAFITSRINSAAIYLFHGRGRHGSHLPTTQCACANFVDFVTQRNGGLEKDLLL